VCSVDDECSTCDAGNVSDALVPCSRHSQQQLSDGVSKEEYCCLALEVALIGNRIFTIEAFLRFKCYFGC